MRAVGERVHDNWFVVTACCLHVGRRMWWDFSVCAHQIDPGSLRLSAHHTMKRDSYWIVDCAVFYVPANTVYRLYGRRFLQVKRPNQTVSKYWRRNAIATFPWRSRSANICKRVLHTANRRAAPVYVGRTDEMFSRFSVKLP